MFPVISTPAAFAQVMMLIGCAIMGLSHILQPQLWVDFFGHLSRQGRAGLVLKILAVELWPALLLVTLHQVWSGPAIMLTIYGWLLLLKVAIGLLVPALGMRSMGLAEPAPRSFIPGGVALLAVGAAAGAALLLPG